MFRALVGLLALGALLFSFTAPAHAQGGRREQQQRERRARQLFEQGDRAYEEGRYEEAIAAFEQAYGLSARPLLLYNIANAQERLGLYVDALENLRLYYEDAPEDERPVLDERLRNLEQRAEQQRARAAAGDTTPIPPSAEPPPPAPSALPPPPPAPSTPLGGILVLSGGGLLLVGAVITGALALVARDDAGRFCNVVMGTRYCRAEAADALGRDSALSLTTDLLAIGGAIAVGFGVWLFVQETSASAPPVRAALTPLPGGAILLADGVF